MAIIKLLKMCRTNIAQIILSSFDKVVLSHSSSTKGRTIRKLMGGGGRGGRSTKKIFGQGKIQ